MTMSTLSPQKHVSKRDCLKSRRSRIVLATVVLIVILAAVIPPVVITTLRKKNSMGPKSKVFVPLYVYPAPGAWTALEEVYVSPSHSAPLDPPLSCLPKTIFHPKRPVRRHIHVRHKAMPSGTNHRHKESPKMKSKKQIKNTAHDKVQC